MALIMAPVEIDIAFARERIALMPAGGAEAR
jgi:hypothetical protein